ncbi:MAG: hypothetical protein AB1758_04635 [Candidatus Eremiobacterota bacterium]
MLALVAFLAAALMVSARSVETPRIYTCVDVSPAFMDGGWGRALMLYPDRYQMLDYSTRVGHREVLQQLCQGSVTVEQDLLTLFDPRGGFYMSLRVLDQGTRLHPETGGGEVDYLLQPDDGGDFVGRAAVQGVQGLHPGMALSEVEQRFGPGTTVPGTPPNTLGFGMYLRVRIDDQGVVRRVEWNTD